MKADDSGFGYTTRLEQLLTAREIAEQLQCSQSAVYKWAEIGPRRTGPYGVVTYGPKLPSIRIGALLRFEPAAVRAWLAGRAGGAPSSVVPLRPRL